MNDTSELEELISLNNKFSKDLDNIYFAGDIVLDQEDVLKIGQKLKNNFSYLNSKDLKSLLLVLSVNTAYYYYDEHGFWKHFNDLTGLAKNIYDQDYIGSIFEEVLLSKDLITERRSGPFRYVGAILGQIGVTKRNIPSYAVIIKKMIDETSVFKVLEKDFNHYSSFIRKNCFNSYLRKYLLDDSGWNFTNQVFKIIHYFDKKILGINNIPDIKGFHLDFWKIFFNYYFENDLENLEIIEFKKPTLFFDPSANIIYLKFFSADIKITEPNIFDFEPNSFKGNFAFFLNKINQFHSKYLGYYLKNKIPISWEIQGWDIKNKSIAIFDERKGFLEVDDLKTLPKGTYFIISRNGFISKLPDNDLELINKLNIESYSFNVYKTVVQRSKKEPEQTKIYWQKVPDLILHGNLYEIFFNDLPNLVIENQHLLEDNSELLLFDIGDGIERIFDYKNLFELRKSVKDKDAYFGKIWTDKLGILKKSNLNEQSNELHFCVIPETEIELPSEIYIADDYVEFICNSTYFYFINCDFNKEIQKYIIPPKTDLIEGSLFIRNKNIDFHHVINRINIVINEDVNLKYIDLSENNIFKLKIYGIPKLKLEFGISLGTFEIVLLKKVLLGETGEYRFDYSEIQFELEKTKINAAKFYVKIQDKILYFYKGIINYRHLLEDFSEIEKLFIHKEIINSIDESLFNRINILFKIFNNEYSVYDYSILENDIVFNNIYIISSILDCRDCSNFKINKKDLGDIFSINLLPQNIIDVLNWYIEANIAINENKMEDFRILINKYAKLKWKSFFYRWTYNLSSVLNSLNDLSDTKNIISEWSLDIFNNRIGKFQSRIANFSGGALLTNAWIKYISSKTTSCLKLLKMIKNENKYIYDLKIFLICLIYLKNFRLESIINLTSQLENKSEITKLTFLINSTSNIIVNNNKNNVDSSFNLLKTLPLLEEDKNLLEGLNFLLISGNNLKSSINYHGKYYWFIALMNYKLNKNEYQKKVLFDEVKNIFNFIPNSPEKYNILKEFYK